jgi:hypothetical protein
MRRLGIRVASEGCKYLIKANEYSTLVSQVTDPSILFVTGDEGRETAELYTKQKTWDKDRRFVVSRVLKPEKERAQLSLIDGDKYEYFFWLSGISREELQIWGCAGGYVLRIVISYFTNLIKSYPY